MAETSKPKEVRCVPMGDEKILAIDWGDRRVVRLYYPTGVGNLYYDEIVYDGSLFTARSGVTDDVKLEHKHAKWEQTYKPTEHDSAIMAFEKAYRDPWWNTFRDAWNKVTSLCPTRIE